MRKSILLVWILLFTSIACQAQNVEPMNKCIIKYSVNESENRSIEVQDSCEVLKDLMDSLIEDISLNVIFYDYPQNVYMSFADETDIGIAGLTYEVALKNGNGSALDDATLRAKLCDELVYASSKYKNSNLILSEPTVTKSDGVRSSTEVKWQIGTLKPGEERTISLNTIYSGKQNPEKAKTEFMLNARIWGFEIFKKNDEINEINQP